jgi:hypothetical protein
MADRQDDDRLRTSTSAAMRIGRRADKRFFRWSRKIPVPFTAQRLSDRGRSDVAIAAFGILLGLICALFPWYIFLNQEKFGIRALRFEGSKDPVTEPIALSSPPPEYIGAPSEGPAIKPEKLDLLATGTLPGDRDRLAAAPGLNKQPFPATSEEFRLVHVANGRAMIEDDSGLFVVQRGSRLPDNSRVAAIVERTGKWVLVTSRDSVVELEPSKEKPSGPLEFTPHPTSLRSATFSHKGRRPGV